MSEERDDLERDLAAMKLLEIALEQPSEDRARFIAEADGFEGTVRERAAELLALAGDAGEDLQTGMPMRGDIDDGPPPERIGPYRIVRELGRGGMGAVYLAERAVGDFEHQVAIKLIRSGALSETLVERFMRERQILADLKHPNIAHLYDGGETEEGAPFIVMEYVTGTPLGTWLNEQEPNLDDRVVLLGQILDAVAFAHANLVIHRDLTPGNIIVADDGTAKLIDFGISRPQEDTGDAASALKPSDLSMTPGFAAPERRSGAEASTALDIFSLGKIMQVMFGASEAPELARIAEHAAAPDPAERYPSASLMKAELDAYRDGLPVNSYSTAPAYRVRKFVTRNWLPAALAGLLLVVLVGSVIALAGAFRAQQQARLAAEQRFEAVRDLATFQIFDLYDDLGRAPGNTASRLALAEKAQVYLDQLTDDREGDPSLMLQAAGGYNRLAEIQGVPARPNLGNPDKARMNLDAADRLLEPLMAARVPGAATEIARNRAFRSAIRLHGDSDMEGAFAAVEEGEAALRDEVDEAKNSAWREVRAELRLSSLEWADLQSDVENLRKYAEAMERELAEWTEEGDPGLRDFYAALIPYYRGSAFMAGEGVANQREAVKLFEVADARFAALEDRQPNAPRPLYYRAWNGYYGFASGANGDLPDKAAMFLTGAREAIERLRSIDDVDDSIASFAINLQEAHAQYFVEIGRFDEAIARQKAVVARYEAPLGRQRLIMGVRDAGVSRSILGKIYLLAGRRAGACENFTIGARLLDELEERDGMAGYIEQFAPVVRDNARKCAEGAPIASLEGF